MLQVVKINRRNPSTHSPSALFAGGALFDRREGRGNEKVGFEGRGTMRWFTPCPDRNTPGRWPINPTAARLPKFTRRPNTKSTTITRAPSSLNISPLLCRSTNDLRSAPVEFQASPAVPRHETNTSHSLVHQPQEQQQNPHFPYHEIAARW